MKININAMSVGLLILAGAAYFPEQIEARRRASSGAYSYRNARAIDGDTFRYRGQSYRIQGYNAPEIGQRGWRSATRSLQNQIDSGSYKWKPVATDVYGRTVVKPIKTR